jgi:cell division protein FtsB
MAPDEQSAIDQFLGDQPSSAQLRQWRETLLTRSRRLRQELKAAKPEEAARLRARLAELERQIAALEQEELITEFVEDSVRVTLAMGSIAEGERMEE